jgi:hypothetical protein
MACPTSLLDLPSRIPAVAVNDLRAPVASFEHGTDHHVCFSLYYWIGAFGGHSRNETFGI